MTTDEQIQAFEADVDALVDRYRSEFDLPYAVAIGVLTMKAQQLCAEATEDDHE